jgi:cysteinyl-tRNA synthetase, unknown class
MRGLALLGALLLMAGCKEPTGSSGRDYRQDMRDLVIGVSRWAKSQRPGFAVVIQNGHEILTSDGTAAGAPDLELVGALDGAARESLFYGYPEDDQPTAPQAQRQMLELIAVAAQQGLTVLVTDYCATPYRVDQSYTVNQDAGHVSFAAARRELDSVPSYPPGPHQTNVSDITQLSAARNFLYLINPGAYPDRAQFLSALAATDYDLLIIDLFHDDTSLSAQELAALKTKANGGTRIALAYMSIGEAEDYRYYFRPEWIVERPPWLEAENPDWPGNYKVRYWDPEWQEIVYGSADSYLGRIVGAGFDGVYLDIIDGFEYFEAQAGG